MEVGILVTVTSVVVSGVASALSARLKKAASKAPKFEIATIREGSPKPVDNIAPVPKSPSLTSGQRVLVAFLCIVCAFAAAVAYHYSARLKANLDLLIYAVALALAMFAGMFVRVVSSNHAAGRRRFDVTLSEILWPLLFSVVVFYPVWATASSTTPGFFSLYAAFMNGFFWETVVSSTRAPNASTGVNPTPAQPGSFVPGLASRPTTAPPKTDSTSSASKA